MRGGNASHSVLLVDRVGNKQDAAAMGYDVGLSTVRDTTGALAFQEGEEPPGQTTARWLQ